MSAKSSRQPVDHLSLAPVVMPVETAGAVMPPLRLLDSVAQFTHHRNIDALDHSMTLSLAELCAARVVVLYKQAGQSGDQVENMVCCRRGADGTYAVESLVPDANELHRVLEQCQQAGGAELWPGDSHVLLVLIRREGTVVGALRLESEQLVDGTQMLVDGFARIYANYIGLSNESERDKLTGLYNRRTFERHLQRLLQQRRQGASVGAIPDAAGRATRVESLWLAILDIHHFKRINDTYGHLYGDEVILLIAQQMRASFRQGDVLFRFGGEEFVVLLSAIVGQAAQAALEGFRERMAAYVFPQIGCVTVSIGYAAVGAHDYPATVLDRADKALYFAKNNGRNQVFRFEALRARGALDESVAAGSVDLF